MKIRYPLIALSMLLGSLTPVQAQISVGIGLPGISIGINMPAYPHLVLVPGYPVYYDPRANVNYFFYDGLYWVYLGDDWYASSWYNGPWQLIQPAYVPLYVLRVPVRYYRRPPVYFRGWRPDAPPRWGQHWGRDWEQRRNGWEEWDRRSAPRAAPLPLYQRQYSGNRYPRAAEQQHAIRSEQYRYRPREAVAQQHFQQHGSNSRAERQQQAPVQQRQSTRQQHLPPDQQPMQPPPHMQRPQAEPQEMGREHRTERADKGRGNNAGPQDKERGNQGEPHNKGRGHRIEEERDRR